MQLETEAQAVSRGAPAGAAESLTPILVDYFTRDGSTLMMRLLSSSPEIAVDPKYPYERKYFNYLWRWARLLDRDEWPAEEWTPRQFASILQEADVPLMGPPPWVPRALTESQPGEPTLGESCFELAWSEFSRRAAAATRAQHSAPRAQVAYYAEKHLNTWRLDLDALPPLRVVALLRDPRDTYVSLHAFNRKRGVEGFGRGRVGSEREFVDRILTRQKERLGWIAGLDPDGPIPVVRYEDMVRDLEGVARRLEAVFSISLDPADVAADKRMRKRHVSAESPEASIGRWRTEMPAEIGAMFEQAIGRELEALGFES